MMLLHYQHIADESIIILSQFHFDFKAKFGKFPRQSLTVAVQSLTVALFKFGRGYVKMICGNGNDEIHGRT